MLENKKKFSNALIVKKNIIINVYKCLLQVSLNSGERSVSLFRVDTDRGLLFLSCALSFCYY